MRIIPSDIIEFLYCPRFIYFMKVLKIPQYEKKRFKVQKGLQVHEKRQKENPDYLWKKIGAVKRESNIWLFSDQFHLSGIIDELVTLEDGSLAPLDFKFSRYRSSTYKTHRTQMICYCLLVDENYSEDVNQGFIYYIRGGHKKKAIKYTDHQKDKIKNTIQDYLEVVHNEKIPQKTKYTSRCNDCTYRNICV